jgi:hypothetical protein
VQPATGSFDPGTNQFGFHIELEFSDETFCRAGTVVRDGRQALRTPDALLADEGRERWVVPNTWVVSVDMHQAASPGVAFFANYDFNDETYLVRNIMPAPP